MLNDNIKVQSFLRSRTTSEAGAQRSRTIFDRKSYNSYNKQEKTRKEIIIMRVIAGSAKRIQLKTIEGLDTRPTTDRIKETLFNMISEY